MIGATLLTLATACAPGPLAAPSGYTVEVPSEVQGFILDAAYISPGDGVGLLVLENALVLDEEGIPANGIRVEVVSGWSGAYVISESAVKIVSDLQEECDADPTVEGCEVWYDANGDQHVEFSGEYLNVDDFRPTYLAGVSDNNGQMPFYVFIDSVPIDENGEPLAIPMYASIGVSVATFDYEFN